MSSRAILSNPGIFWSLPMVFARYFNLFRGQRVFESDTGLTFTAGLAVMAELQLQ